MASSDDRFYLMEMSNRPVKYGDIGSLVRIEGVVIGGGGSQAVLMLPGLYLDSNSKTETLNVEEWSDFIHRSDDPEILIGPVPNGSKATLPKIFQRKVRYEISGAVQQKVWAADNFSCQYCGGKLGHVFMTVDHLMPLELGGANDITNFVTACKPCNKAKGSQEPREWCASRSINYEGIIHHLAERVIKV
jgi:hypothetical protein